MNQNINCPLLICNDPIEVGINDVGINDIWSNYGKK